MLTITVFKTESFNDETQEFVGSDGFELSLEHSLVSLSKWEQKHEKPFLGKDEKSSEEILDYIKLMTLTPNVPAEIFDKLSSENAKTINSYIEAKMTGTQFPDQPGAPSTRQTISAELVYYWMTVFKIPFTCETWHLNRLFALIRVCNIKQDSDKPKKMSRGQIAQRNRELNAKRKAELNTRG